MSTIFENSYNNILALNRDLCYLAHPGTSYGDYNENKTKSKMIQAAIQEKYKTSIVNPLSTIHPDCKWSEAMQQCRSLFDICSVLILSPDWEKSAGCRQEVIWAIETKKIIYIVVKASDSFDLIPMRPEDLLSRVVF